MPTFTNENTVCIGNYAKELEEDYTVYDAISEVQGILGANEVKCCALKAQYSKYGYLWKRDLNETLKVWSYSPQQRCRQNIAVALSTESFGACTCCFGHAHTVLHSLSNSSENSSEFVP